MVSIFNRAPAFNAVLAFLICCMFALVSATEKTQETPESSNEIDKRQYFDSLGGMAMGKRQYFDSLGGMAMGKRQYFDSLGGMAMGRRKRQYFDSLGGMAMGKRHFDSLGGLALGKRRAGVSGLWLQPEDHHAFDEYAYPDFAAYYNKK